MMPISLTVKRIGDNLVPVDKSDVEALSGVKQGQGFRVEMTKVSDRSIKHHRLYWGGLIRLVADYWEPDSGLISVYDKKVMKGLIDWVSTNGGDSKPIEDIIRLYLDERADKIKQHLPEHDKAAATLHSIHEWIKEEANYYDAVLTPTGVKKKLRSINFNAMRSEEEFNEFYKAAFSVCWRYVLSKAQFSSMEEAENIALEMSRMG